MSGENMHTDIWTDDELDTALAEFRADDVEDDGAALSRARTLLLSAADVDAPAVVRPVRARRRPARRWLAAAVAVGVLVAGGLAAQTSGLFGADRGAASAEAASLLNHSADAIAANSRDVPVKPGQYRYITTHAWKDSSQADPKNPRTWWHYLREQYREQWVPANPDDTWMYRNTITPNRKWIVGSEQQAAASGAELDRPGTEEGTAKGGLFFRDSDPKGSWGSPTPAFVAALPRDPDEIYDRLRAVAKGRFDENSMMVREAGSALSTGQLPADVRAIIYRALTKVSGLRVTENVANLDGKRGTALGVSVAGSFRVELIIDPATGEFIGEREIQERAEDGVQQGVRPGTVIASTSVTSAVVDRIGAKPAG